MNLEIDSGDMPVSDGNVNYFSSMTKYFQHKLKCNSMVLFLAAET